MFLPSNTLLGKHREMDELSYTITYEKLNEITGILTPYPVTLSALDILPETINIDGNTISGFFSDSFSQSLQFLDIMGNYTTVTKFTEAENVDETIAFHPSMVQTRNFNILAMANNETQTYTITVLNDWTSGRDSLVALVEGTR